MKSLLDAVQRHMEHRFRQAVDTADAGRAANAGQGTDDSRETGTVQIGALTFSQKHGFLGATESVAGIFAEWGVADIFAEWGVAEETLRKFPPGS